jgi:hypothetical protein
MSFSTTSVEGTYSFRENTSTGSSSMSRMHDSTATRSAASMMRTRGWRFNGQQYPNAIHMAVTRPQTQPGVAETFATDLADAVAYAHAHKDDAPRSGAVYGGVAGGMTDEADAFIKMMMAQILDTYQSLPPEP